jgi:hypothetical protein
MHNHVSVGRPRDRCGRGGLGRAVLPLVSIGLAAVLGLTLSTTPVSAATPCAETGVTVTADDRDDVRVACRGAIDAVAFLADRGFTVGKQVNIEVIESIDVIPGASVLGFYDPKANVVKVLARAAFSSGETRGTVLGLPIDDVLYGSIFAHEVAHAVIYQNLDRRKLSFAAHEYLAYAVQLATLPTDYSDRVVAPFSGTGFTDLDQVSEIILGMDPDRFAAKSYLHFRELDDRDAVVRQLVADFPRNDSEWY